MKDNSIGSMDWEACKDCVHDDALMENCCNLSDTEFYEGLKIDGDLLFCGGFEDKEANTLTSPEPMSQWVAYGKIADALEKHRKKATISCDEHCFCWEVEPYLIEKGDYNGKL